MTNLAWVPMFFRCVSNQQWGVYFGMTRGTVNFGVACNCGLAEGTRCAGTVCDEVGVWRSDTFFYFCTTNESRGESQGINILVCTEKQWSEQGTHLYWEQVDQCSFSSENSWRLFTKQVRMCHNASNKCPLCADIIFVCFVPESTLVGHEPLQIWSHQLQSYCGWKGNVFLSITIPNRFPVPNTQQTHVTKNENKWQFSEHFLQLLFPTNLLAVQAMLKYSKASCYFEKYKTFEYPCSFLWHMHNFKFSGNWLLIVFLSQHNWFRTFYGGNLTRKPRCCQLHPISCSRMESGVVWEIMINIATHFWPAAERLQREALCLLFI